jgi:hypothetical protein
LQVSSVVAPDSSALVFPVPNSRGGHAATISGYPPVPIGPIADADPTRVPDRRLAATHLGAQLFRRAPLHRRSCGIRATFSSPSCAAPSGWSRWQTAFGHLSAGGGRGKVPQTAAAGSIDPGAAPLRTVLLRLACPVSGLAPLQPIPDRWRRGRQASFHDRAETAWIGLESGKFASVHSDLLEYSALGRKARRGPCGRVRCVCCNPLSQNVFTSARRFTSPIRRPAC